MKPEEFCDGVKILLARMETNPEDFDRETHDYRKNPLDPETTTPKFYWFYEAMMRLLRGDDMKSHLDWAVLHKAEKDALVNGFKNMMRKKFSESVMKSLMEEKKEELSVRNIQNRAGKQLRLNQSQVEIMKRLNEQQKSLYLKAVQDL